MLNYNILFFSDDEKWKGEDGTGKWWFSRSLGDKVAIDCPTDYETASSYLKSKSYDLVLIDRFKEPYNIYKSLLKFQQDTTFMVVHDRGLIVRIDNITDKNIWKLNQEGVPDFDIRFDVLRFTKSLRDIIEKGSNICF